MEDQVAVRTPVKQNKDKKLSLLTAGTYFDYPTLFLILFLVLFGLVMVYSTSFYKANQETGSGAAYFKKQLLFAVIGIVAMLGLSYIRYSRLRQWSTMFMLISYALIGAVFFVGVTINGAKRWLAIGPIQFQPSEIAKLSLIVYMARVLTDYSKQLESLWETIKMFIFPGVLVGIICIENLSTGIICGIILVGMWFIATPKIRYFIIIGIVGIALVVGMVMLKGYRGERFQAWLNPETSDAGYQTMQSLYAIGSGGLFGRGLGQSIQKMGFIPESYNDMIFSVICEELGIIGAVSLIVIFVFLVLRFKFIANAAADRFGAFLVSGVIIHIAAQVLINICVSTNVIPNTGVTLPFISYGGTSLCILLAEMAVVLSVARQIKPHRE